MIDSEAQVVHCTAVRSHMGILGSFLRLEEKGQYRRLPHGRPTCGLHGRYHSYVQEHQGMALAVLILRPEYGAA